MQNGDLRTLVVVVLALMTLVGCGKQSAATGAHAGSGSGGGSSGVGETADYDFTATTLDGGTFHGTSLKGKPAALWFWAPWCPTCRAQIPTVTRLAKTYEGEVAVVGVGGMAGKAEIRELARKEIPHVTHLIDPGGDVWQHFGVTAQSTFTVIGADGEIQAQGYLDDSELAEQVARLAG